MQPPEAFFSPPEATTAKLRFLLAVSRRSRDRGAEQDVLSWLKGRPTFTAASEPTEHGAAAIDPSVLGQCD